jgi:serine/threonine protein kinase
MLHSVGRSLGLDMADPTHVEGAEVTRVEGEATGKAKADPPIRITGGSWLPPSLAARYEVIHAFPAGGAQAELYLVRGTAGGNPVVLKVYRRGLRPKADVLEAIRSCDPRHVVRLYDSGEIDGVWFEVLEHGVHGTVRDLLKSGSLNVTQVVGLLRQVSEALSHIHSKNIIHRDLKPANILVRSREPLGLVLMDFGIASVSEATRHFTTSSRTVKYGAPEAAAGVVSSATDYWALGLIVLEALTGKHPFDGLSDLVIFQQMLTSTIDLSGVKDPRWSLLCRGLLTRDHTKRWGAEEVRAWLAGKTPTAFFEQGERSSQRPYRIAKQECWTCAELAIALAGNWEWGVRDLARGLLTPWLREELRDQDACRLLLDLTEDQALSNDERLLRFIAEIGRGLPPNWKGSSLEPASLAALCEDNLKDVPKHPGFVQELFERRVLGVWERAGNEDAGTIQKLWEESVSGFHSFWERLSNAGAPIGQAPDARMVLPALLLLIVSTECRQTLKNKIAVVEGEAARCNWYALVDGNESLGALLLRYWVREIAATAGREEIEASRRLADQITPPESDFAQMLPGDPEYHSAFDTLHQALRKNLARQSAEQVANIRQQLFERADYVLAAAELRRLRQNWLLELVLDAAIIASIFALGRYIIGEVATADGFAYIWPFIEADGRAVPFGLSLVVLIGAVTLLLLLGQRAARTIGEHFLIGRVPSSTMWILLTGIAVSILLVILPQSVVLGLDRIVLGVPLLGWFGTGFLVGLVASIAIKVGVWRRPSLASVIHDISDMGRFRSAVAMAKRHLRARVVVAVPLVMISIGLVGASAVLGRGYPWSGPIAQKIAAIEGLAGQSSSRPDKIISSAALSDADRLVRTPPSAHAAGAAHAQGLRLLRELAVSSTNDGAEENPIARRAKSLLTAYLQETLRLIDTRNSDARVRAAALAELGEPVGHYWLGQVHEHGLGDAPDLVAAYEQYSIAARHNISGAAPALEQLVNRMLLADSRSQEVAYRHIEFKARAGDANAQFWLGYRYTIGDGVEPD